MSDELNIGNGTDEQFQYGVSLRNQISALNGAGRKLIDMSTPQIVEKE